jgi:hypothetical protein
MIKMEIHQKKQQEKITFESIVRYNVPVTVLVEITPTDN